MQEELKVTNINQAINVLIQGVNLAQTKGVYSFNDSVAIKSSLDFLEAQSKQSESTEAPEMEVVDTTAE